MSWLEYGRPVEVLTRTPIDPPGLVNCTELGTREIPGVPPAPGVGDTVGEGEIVGIGDGVGEGVFVGLGETVAVGPPGVGVGGRGGV